VPNRVSKQGKLNNLRATHLSKIPWLMHGFSTRGGGSSQAYGGGALNLGFTKEDSKAAVERNRSAFFREIGAAGKRKKTNNGSKTPSLVTLRQIHSDIIHFVDAPPQSQLVGDGIVTATPGLMLGIQTADCLPIILVDSKRHAVGVFHAGWRGTFKRIAEKGVGRMQLHFGSRPRDIKAAIGPGIHRCCYEVGEEVKTKFESQFPYGPRLFHETEEVNPVREKYPMLFLTARAPGHSILPKKIFLDLVEANRQQLLAVGVLAKNIEASPLCTNCRPDLLFSYRAEKGKTGRMMGVVGIRE
jgi:polyphenol oxidase